MGTPRGRWPRARGKRKQGARWGVGGREATERNSFSAWGVANLLSPGPRVFTRPTSGSAGPPRSAAPAPSHAPLTRHLSPGLRFVCAFFFPSSRARHRPPAASSPLPRPPPPFPGRITFPGLCSGSPGCLQRPVCGRAIAEPPKPAGSSAGGGRGEGRGRARTFDPGGPRRRSRVWRVARGRGATGARGRCGGRWRGREQPRSGERASEGARRGSEGAASEGSASGAVTGTATGVKGAQLQEAGPPQRRSL